jgi:hypothetical protein
MTPTELTALAEAMRAFLDAHQIVYVIDATLSAYKPTLHLRLEDFARVYAGKAVPVETTQGYDHLRMECNDFHGGRFGVLACRPMPMVIGPRVEVMP